MSATHKSRVRPGDRWDGVSITVVRTGVAWANARFSVVLRRFPRGPVVQTIVPRVNASSGSATVVFHVSGADTAKLTVGTTYYGEVVVTVPGALPGDEPAFGPYTLFTWDLETADVAQPAAGSYTLTWVPSQATFNIALSESGGVGPAGPGFRLGDPLYIAPISRTLWLTIDGVTYYPAVRALVNGQPIIGWDGSAGTISPQ